MDTLLVGAQLSNIFFILQRRAAYHYCVATVYLVSIIIVQVLIRYTVQVHVVIHQVSSEFFSVLLLSNSSHNE